MRENNALVVDDDKNFGKLLGDILNHKGYDVVCCENGEDALAAAKNTRFQVVITDYRMPGMCGTEVAKALRAGHPRAFIIGISLDSLEREFLDAGADVFILKHALLPGLISQLERLTHIEAGGWDRDVGQSVVE